jgi:hypothetical protein
MDERMEETAGKQFHLRMSQELFDRLERVAKQGHWSVSALMRLILEEGLKAREVSVSDIKRLEE